MDIRGYVYSLIDDLPSILKPGARFIADRVFTVWNDVSNVFRVSVPWWKYIRDAVAAYTVAALEAAEKAAIGLRWIILVYLPRLINTVIGGVVNWVSGLINDVRRDLASVRDWLLDQAHRLFSSVVQFATDIYHWAIDRFREVWDLLSTVAERVIALLFDPAKLAEWAIGAIWSAFWRYADQHIDRIVEFAWQRRSIIISRILARVEAIIERLL